MELQKSALAIKVGLVLAALILPLFLSATDLSAGDGWSISYGVGYLPDYEYRVEKFTSFVDRRVFDGSILHQLTVRRALVDHLELTFGAGLMNFERDISLVHGLGLGGVHSRAKLNARLLPFAVGLRYYPTTNPASPVWPYFEAAPLLLWSRWKETQSFSNGEFATRADTFSRIMPGFTARGGFSLRPSRLLKIEFGVVYFYSGTIGERDLGSFSSGKFKGLNQMGAQIGVSLSP